MRKIPVELLQPGMKVGRPLYDSMGFLLLNSGVILKNDYIARLQKLHVSSIYIEDKRISDIVVEDIIMDETRQEAYCLVKSILDDISKQPEKKRRTLLFTSRKLNIVLDDMIAQLLNNTNLVVNLSDIRLADNYTFNHSVNVAVLALTTAISLGGFTRNTLQKLGMGAFLHDLGKTKIPLSILNKQGRLLPEELAEIKKHPRYGYDLAKCHDLIDSSSAAVIFQHHERINGNGYPQNLTEKEIHTFAKICSIVDVYDALVTDRPYRPALPPHKALEIMKGARYEFDLSFLQQFYKHIAAYPIGTIVGLSNNVIGIVTHNTVGFPTRPNVRVFWTNDFQKVNPYEIDLKDKINIVVDMVIEEKELPEAELVNLYS